MYFNDAFLPNFVVDTQKSEKITSQFVTFFIDDYYVRGISHV